MINNMVQALINNPEEAMQWLIAFGILHCFELVVIIGLHALHDSNARKIGRLRKELLALRQRGGYSGGG